MLGSCNKNKNHPVPSLPMDLLIYINLPSYSGLESIGGWAYASGGSKGLIIYRSSFEDFVVFDRHSPANDGTCEQALEANEDNFLQLDDLCSEAKFSLLDGSIIKPSTILIFSIAICVKWRIIKSVLLINIVI